MRIVAIVGAGLLALCATAGAQVPPKDGAISVKPGKWQWKQETNVLAIPINEENLECLIPQESKITLSKLARDLEEGCTVENVAAISGGYSFKLVCKGKTNGDAKATITHTQTSMKIRAEGSAMLGFIPAGFSMKADATYLGDCSAEETAKATERWKKENGIK